MPRNCFPVASITTAIVNIIWYLNLVVVTWNSVLILVLDLIFLWLMWKPHSDGSLISQFNSNIQKQRNNSSLTCCFSYRMKLNLRSKRSEYFSLKSTETYISTDNFRPRISVSDWLIFCSGNLMLHLKRIENNRNTNFMMKNSTNIINNNNNNSNKIPTKQMKTS